MMLSCTPACKGWGLTKVNIEHCEYYDAGHETSVWPENELKVFFDWKDRELHIRHWREPRIEEISDLQHLEFDLFFHKETK